MNEILVTTARLILRQLQTLVEQIKDEDFACPASVLHGATVGQHIRHTVEFFMCLESAQSTGVINYDRRAHDLQMQTNRSLALAGLERASTFIASLAADQPLMLEVSYDPTSETFVSIPTNTMRELMYNIEHAVHHMAIIRAGIREVAPYAHLPKNFGVAASTLRHQNKSAGATSS